MSDPAKAPSSFQSQLADLDIRAIAERRIVDVDTFKSALRHDVELGLVVGCTILRKYIPRNHAITTEDLREMVRIFKSGIMVYLEAAPAAAVSYAQAAELCLSEIRTR
jgi:hypothetical protein